MDDLIYRSDALEALGERPLGWEDNDWELGQIFQWESDVDAIKGVPSAEPEIIRCKDCKHWKSNEFIGNNDVLTANLHSYPCKFGITDAEWYCAYAERRQDALN